MLTEQQYGAKYAFSLSDTLRNLGRNMKSFIRPSAPTTAVHAPAVHAPAVHAPAPSAPAPSAPVFDPHGSAPRYSQRESEVMGGNLYRNIGLGGTLAGSPEGAFLRTDPRFRYLYTDAVRNMKPEGLDALARHLVPHQAAGTKITPELAHSVLRSPEYIHTLSNMKTGSIRRAARDAVLAAYGFRP